MPQSKVGQGNSVHFVIQHAYLWDRVANHLPSWYEGCSRSFLFVHGKSVFFLHMLGTYAALTSCCSHKYRAKTLMANKTPQAKQQRDRKVF